MPLQVQNPEINLVALWAEKFYDYCTLGLKLSDLRGIWEEEGLKPKQSRDIWPDFAHYALTVHYNG